MKTIALVFLPLLVATALQAQDDDLPAGKGKDALENVCTTCHDLSAVTSLTGNKDSWQQVVDDMKGRGADASDADFAAIVDYLSKFYGLPINVNKAAAKDLADSLYITSDEAAAMVKFRTDNGDFKTWADLEKVAGLDIKKIEPLKKRILFKDPTPPAAAPPAAAPAAPSN